MDTKYQYTNRVIYTPGNTWAAVLDDPQPSTVVEDTKEKIELEPPKGKPVTVAKWGSNNKLPFELLDDIRKTGVLGSGLRKRARIHFGRGVVAFRYNTDDNGKQTVVPIDSTDDIAIWLKKNRINSYFQAAQISDYETFAIAFPEFVLDKAGNNINKVSHKSAPFIRLSVKEKDKDKVWRSKWAAFSKVWAEKTPEKDNMVAIPVLDPSMTAEEAKVYCKENKITNFIRPVYIYTAATDYYPIPNWNAARESGWVGITQLVPKIKAAIMQNSMTIKYIVKIPLDYWDKKYPDGQFKKAEKQALVEEDLNLLDEFLKDYKNTGSNLVTYFDYDKITKQQVGSWQIEVIDNKIKDGALTIDSAAANSEVLFAIGISPILIGSSTPGKEIGGNSGSNLLESYNVAITDAILDRYATLDTLNFVRDWQGWGDDLEFMYEDNILTTLDKNPTGVQKRSV